jgi:hypothetical protein
LIPVVERDYGAAIVTGRLNSVETLPSGQAVL